MVGPKSEKAAVAATKRKGRSPAPPVPPSAVPWLPRAEAKVRISFKTRDGATVLDTLHQAGAGRARFPNPLEGAEPQILAGEGIQEGEVRRPAMRQAQAILLNMAGGLTGGDSFDVDLDLLSGADATVTTAAAEKIYRSLQGSPARLSVATRLAAGSRLLWLPQPTILFDRAVLARSTTVDLAADARFLGAECLIFGRAAMGEDVRQGAVRDAWRVRRDGRLVFADTLRLAGEIAQTLEKAATFGGARATAMVIYVARDAPARLEQVRALIADTQGALDGTLGASAWGEILLLRGLAKDGRRLQQELRPVIEALSGRSLPRIWQC